MKEFTSLITVELLDGTNGKHFDVFADHFEFSPVASEDDNGRLWNCDKTFVIDLPDAATQRLLQVTRSAILTLNVVRGTPVRLGTRDIPARVRISPHLNKAQLIVSCKMLESPIT